MSEREKGDLAEAVDTFFDRMEDTLPSHVPRGPSTILAMASTLVVFAQGMITVLQDKRDTANSDDALKKFRWILMLAVLLSVCASLYDFVQDKAYSISMFTLNKQHITNLHWMRKYKRALA